MLRKTKEKKKVLAERCLGANNAAKLKKKIIALLGGERNVKKVQSA